MSRKTITPLWYLPYLFSWRKKRVLLNQQRVQQSLKKRVLLNQQRVQPKKRVLLNQQRVQPKNPDEKIYLDFGDQFFKIDQKSFSPGLGPPGRDFSKKWGKTNPKKIQRFSKNPKHPLTLIPPGGPYYRDAKKHWGAPPPQGLRFKVPPFHLIPWHTVDGKTNATPSCRGLGY